MKHMTRFLSLLCALLLTASCACAEPEIIIPEEYARTGTLPVYAAAERDFRTAVQPEMFNSSGIADTLTGKHGYTAITFRDEARLSWDAAALYYETYDGVCEITYELESGEKHTVEQPRPSMAHATSNLALWMLVGWPETGEVYALEQTALTEITLEQAMARAEALFAALGLEGYICEAALDMTVSRIREMGEEWNALIDQGRILNNPRLDYSAATAQHEGYLLHYNRFGAQGDVAGMFHANVYVTAQGFASINLYDRYAAGEIRSTPAALVSYQAVAEALPRELQAARHPLQLGEMTRIRLTWCPVRAENAQDGMVFTPAWIISFTCTGDEQGGTGYYAIFDAVDGHLITGNWI